MQRPIVPEHSAAPLPPDGPFVGRRLELAELQAMLERVPAGRGQVALLGGEPGIGKTRIAEELASLAQQAGLRVFWGRCREGGGAPAYWPWVQVLRGAVSSAENLPDAGLSSVAHMLPEVRERHPHIPALPEAEPEQARAQLFDGVARWVRSLAAGVPCMLVLEDLHWADDPTLQLLEFVAAELADAGLLLLATWRAEEVGRQPQLAATLAQLTRLPYSRRLELRGLPRAAVADYLAQVAGYAPPAAAVQRIYRETEGTPLFVVEVTRMLLAEGGLDHYAASAVLRTSENVRDVIRYRLGRLPARCTQALGQAAVIGREFDLRLLAQVAGDAPDEVLVTLEPALEARLIEDAPALGRLRFSHALVYEVVYHDLSAAQRRQLHGAVGRALETLHAGYREPYLAELAHHFYQAAPLGDANAAIAYAVQAGDQAMAGVAWEQAVQFYEQALELTGLQADHDALAHCDLLLALGTAQWYAGRPQAAFLTFEPAVEAARRAESPQRLAAAALGLSGFDVVGSQINDRSLIRLLEEALAALGDADDRLRVRLLCQLIFQLFDGDDLVERRRALGDEALRIARRLADPSILPQVLDAYWYALLSPDTFQERRRIAVEQLRAAEQAGDRYGTMMAHASLAIDALEAGEMDVFRANMTVYRRIAEELRLRVQVFGTQFIAIIQLLCDGQLALAEEGLHAIALDEQRALPTSVGERLLGLVRVVLRREQARSAEVEEMAARYAAETRGAAQLFWQVEHAILRYELGNTDDARSRLERLAEQRFDDIPRDGAWLDTLARLAELSALLGDERCAALLYNLLCPYPERNAQRYTFWIYHGSVSHYLGLLATTLGNFAAAERHFRDALAMHERMGTRLFVTQTQLAYAQLLLQPGVTSDTSRVVDLARQALATSDELGLVRLGREARQVLAAAPPATRDAAHGLSPRELEVLRLIVEGKPDREIADALYISHRTVMRHVTNILNKLGVSSRTAAATYAVRNDLI